MHGGKSESIEWFEGRGMVKPGKIKRKGRHDTVEIPVVVDDVKFDDEFQMARCTYFSIESQEGSAEPWTFGLRGPDLPILLIGTSGAIIGPSPKHVEFRSADDLDELFNRIEDDTSFVVETSNIWLPNDLPVRQGGLVQDLVRGDVLRVGRDLFVAGQQYGQQSTTLEYFLETTHRLAEQIRVSHEESSVIGEWTARQLAEAKEVYGRLRDQGKVLEWRDDQGNIQPG
jgi:hypothetical protein